MTGYVVQQRTRDVANSLDALRDDGFIERWHKRTTKGMVLWTVVSLHREHLLTTREVEIFIVGAKAILFNQRVAYLLADGES